MDGAQKEENTFQIIVLGDSNVGKSCLLHRYMENEYKCPGLTLCVESFAHSLEIEPGVHVKLSIWDTGGLEIFRPLIRCHYHDSVGGLLVFDITDRVTFEHIKEWHADLCEAESKVVLILVGQKCDEEELRGVSREEAERLAEELDMPYVETSAKTGQNVSEVFENLIQRIYQKLHSHDVLHKCMGLDCTFC
ncbi:ras-related protein Rab-39A-like [Boleophthalmus pectinirostris]|uniref:ras-related protein Rab-39A-like n=1 Tax=Boleophthalmus pectinirostris TaxID=150288 RepID=UPI000A1C6B63|nr:ras-related protein Rab-39A-like [Boleophthalmus pectinirostris]